MGVVGAKWKISSFSSSSSGGRGEEVGGNECRHNETLTTMMFLDISGGGCLISYTGRWTMTSRLSSSWYNPSCLFPLLMARHRSIIQAMTAAISTRNITPPTARPMARPVGLPAKGESKDPLYVCYVLEKHTSHLPTLPAI